LAFGCRLPIFIVSMVVLLTGLEIMVLSHGSALNAIF
jgi:hypothetical protein